MGDMSEIGYSMNDRKSESNAESRSTPLWTCRKRLVPSQAVPFACLKVDTHGAAGARKVDMFSG
jgi:hypothetical protein